MRSVFMPRRKQFFDTCLTCIQRIWGDSVPIGLPGHTAFIPYPADTGPCIAEENYIGFHFAHKGKGTRPVVIGRTVNAAPLISSTVITISSVCSVKPHREDRPVFGEELLQLIPVIPHIRTRTIIRAVPVPGRQIDAELQPVFAAGIRYFPDEIAFSVFIGTVLDRMLSVRCRPQTESVVMFSGENHSAKSGVF